MPGDLLNLLADLKEEEILRLTSGKLEANEEYDWWWADR